MLNLLRQTVAVWFNRIFRRRPRQHHHHHHHVTAAPPAAAACPEPPPPVMTPPPLPDPDHWPAPDRFELPISDLERARRRHDKFVKPNGTLPARPKRDPRPTQEIKPESLAKPDDTPDPPSIDEGLGWVVEPHHENRAAGEVLFKVEEALGEFNFRDTVLDQLDRYFFYLKRMKRGDPDAYGFYRHVGATILPYLATGAFHRRRRDDHPDRTLPIGPLPAWFNETRPAFGCYAYGTDPETEKFEREQDPEHPGWTLWMPKFMYFHKCKVVSSDVQPMKGGDIYKLTIWWDRPSDKIKHGVPQSMPIFVSKDGKTIMALKVLKTSYTPMRSRRGRRGQFSIPSRRWEIPKEYREWAKQHEEDIQHFLTSMFVDAINQTVNSQMSMTRIEVTKNRMTAVFSVNIRRTAYFFKDRDIEITQAGTRRPIFHLVRPHIRKDGHAVKMHFRGAREFTWAGYNVRITVPGLDHIDINEFDIGSVDSGEIKDMKGYVSMPEMGKRMADVVHRGMR